MAAEEDELVVATAEVLAARGCPCGTTTGGARGGPTITATGGAGGRTDPRTAMEGAE
jgi:hypothetical protein